MEKVRVYITEKEQGKPILFLISTYSGTPDMGSTLFLESSPDDFNYDSFELIDTPEHASYFLYPHPIRNDDEKRSTHFAQAKHAARAAGKPLLVFAGGDLAHDMFIDDVVLLKGSQYRYQAQGNEIVMPHYIEDLGTRRSFTVRKKTERPVVSFCGWTGTNSLVSGVKVWLKNTYYTMLSLLPGNGHMVIRKKGIWWRSRAILRLKQDAHVDTRFIERKSFSGSTKTISLDPVQAREEYIENMYDTDFALAPKGDPNISLRFYEALSMGRVPILIDTQVMLPAEDMLDYDSFVLRVPYQDIDRIAAIVVAFYENLTDESFAAMQRAARKAFTTYLRYDTYFNYLFTSAELQRAAKAVIR